MKFLHALLCGMLLAAAIVAVTYYTIPWFLHIGVLS